MPSFLFRFPRAPIISSDTSGTFTFGERAGLLAVAVMASVSFIVVSTLLIMIAMQAYRRWRNFDRHKSTPIHVFFVSLLISDLIQASGAIFHIKWVVIAGVKEGAYCTAQAVLKQAGDTGVALSTLAIALETFGLIGLKWKICYSKRVAAIAIAVIWIFLFGAAFFGVFMHHRSPQSFYGNTMYWCWIRDPPYLGFGIVFQYIWMWTAAFCSFALYVPVGIYLYRHHVHKKMMDPELEGVEGTEQMNYHRIAKQMWCYPMVYTVTILPISITRFIEFLNPHTPPFAAIASSAFLLASSGTFNVILFSYTRPSLIPNKEKEAVKRQQSAWSQNCI